MKTRNTLSWVELLGNEGIVISGVETLEEAIEGDIVASRQMVAVIPTPDGPLRVLGSPIKFIGQQASYSPPPMLGEHNSEILTETIEVEKNEI
jgi:crotonobetainyl-CoA:carnitine CoA-transferase CaiB-like acyl-CoA transferase